MELVEGPVSFLDTRNNKRDGGAIPQTGADGNQRRAVRPSVPGTIRCQVVEAQACPPAHHLGFGAIGATLKPHHTVDPAVSVFHFFPNVALHFGMRQDQERLTL